MESESDSECDYDSGMDLTEEDGDFCPICNVSRIIDNPNTKRVCNVCKDFVCLKCVAITEKNTDIGECINCFNKECQECTSDITKQLEEYLEEKELPLYIEENTKVLNCDECYKKYYT